MSTKRKQTKGRSKGTPNTAYKEVEARAARCPNQKCQSTERTAFHRTNKRRLSPNDTYARIGHTHEVYRYCKCKLCGQAIVVKTYETLRGGVQGVTLDGAASEQDYKKCSK